MSYYPAGVTSLEDEIAGPRAEHQDEFNDVECINCGRLVLSVIATTLVWRTETTVTWICPHCGEENLEFRDAYDDYEYLED